ncbi:MAG: hypothetical protein Q4A93_07430 [Actinomycetota bacterium]|nr:hypothetical protein [Actinomycetota bacterium]
MTMDVPVTSQAILMAQDSNEVAKLTSDYLDTALGAQDLFGSLGSDVERPFENAIARLANTCHNRKALVEKLRADLAKANEHDSATRYSMFYCMVTALRYDRNVSEGIKAVEEYGDEFSSFPSFTHLQLLAKLQEDLSTYTDDEVDQLIADGFKSSQRVPFNEGYPHLFADLVATACEQARGDRLAQLRQMWLQRAVDAANAAIALERNYAKFYCTLGRLQAQQGLYVEAQRNINHAIDLESPERTDYAVRIGGYQAALINVRATEVEENTQAVHDDIRQSVESFSEELDAAREDLANARTSNLEFLGFFAALISFTIGSIGLVQGASASDAAGIIVVLAGALLLAFAGFTFIVLRNRNEVMRKALPMAALGAVVLILGFIWLHVGA